MQNKYTNPKDFVPSCGDWVCFYQGGKLVIGRVQYITESEYYPYGKKLMTDIGSVDIAYVLEARPAN